MSFTNENVETAEFDCLSSDGSSTGCTLSLSPASYDGEYCTQAIFTTLVDESALEDRIKEISSQDLLTGLFNRQYFYNQLQ